MNSPDPAEGPPLAAKTMERISRRVHKHLDEHTVLPSVSVQYYVSETGPGWTRPDPRELAAALKWLANRPDPGPGLEHGPWEPCPDIYVTPAITRTNARANAAVAAKAKADQLNALASVTTNRAAALAIPLAEFLGAAGRVVEVDVSSLEGIGAGARWPAAGARFHIGRGKNEASVWVTADLSWLFPDDPRLWRHLEHCAEAGTRPVVVARKIAVSAFPLLKRTGAYGVQLHHLYVPDALSDSVEQAFAGGPPTELPERVVQHEAVQEHLAGYLASAPTEKPPDGVIRRGLELGLHRGDRDGLAALKEWAGSAELDMPPRWKAQITLYQRWRQRSSGPASE